MMKMKLSLCPIFRDVTVLPFSVQLISPFLLLLLGKSPSKATTAIDSTMPKQVGLVHVSQVISDVYGNRMATGNSSGDADSFPLQQKILVCSLLLLVKQQKAKEVTLGKVSVQISSQCMCHMCT